MPSAIEAIAEWCHTPPQAEAAAGQLARHAIIDTLACMVAGRADASVQAVRDAFSATFENGPCRVIGGGRTSPTVAALVNGTAAHALDYDDNFRPGMSHASAVLVPALLAVADLADASGSSFIEAYLVGLQAQAFIGAGMGLAHYRVGWHGTSTVGSNCTAAGTAKLLGLDRAGIAGAISMAVSMASGPKGQFGTPAKPFHAGMAARNAVEAALLARSGMRGRMDILEGAQGFRELFAGEDTGRWGSDVIAATTEHVIETEGVMPKRHPCCGSTHLIIDALLDLLAENDVRAEDVTSVETQVGIANYRNLAYPAPRDEMEARFSMQYCVARTLRRGRLELSDFTARSVMENAGDPLLRRISMQPYGEEEERAAEGRPPHRVTLRLADGRVYTRERLFAKGTLAEPFSEDDRRRKFLDCCAGLGDPEGLYESLNGLEAAAALDFLDMAFQEISCFGGTAELMA